MSRARTAAALLAVITTGLAVVAITLTPAQAAPPLVGRAAAAAETTTVSQAGTATTLTVDPVSNLPASGAKINVQGKGFGTNHGLYIAVCADGSGAPQKLTSCVGGAIPGSNTTTAWAHITTSGQGQGGVNAPWGPDGSFAVTLTLPAVAGGSPDCMVTRCALYTRSDDDSDRGADNAVPVTFAAAPASSSAPSTPQSAIVQQIGTPSITPGSTQLVIFSGFRPGEQVNLTLFSDPITLSPVTADTTGVARVQFVIPAGMAAGTHRLEAIGQQSGSVGVASFEVAQPPPPPSPTPSPTPTPTPSSSAATSASSSLVSSSAPATSTAVTTSSAATAGDSGNSRWWIWLILAIVVLAGIITWILVYRRNQQQKRAEEEKQLADAAARQQGQGTGRYDPTAEAPTVFLPPVAPGPGGPPPGADPYGLLSGRDHPDALYPAGPTEYLGGQPHPEGPGPYGQPPGYGTDRPASDVPPEFSGPPPAGSPGPEDTTRAMPRDPGNNDAGETDSDTNPGRP